MPLTDSPTIKITHRELCIATAKKFLDMIALYEYKSSVSTAEEPDVLIFGHNKSILFEIKMSLSDFNADKHKECRKTWRLTWGWKHLTAEADRVMKAREKLKKEIKLRGEENAVRLEVFHGKPDLMLVEKEHLGKLRYFVCPEGIIPESRLPAGWGLYYFKNGKFHKKRESQIFRTDLFKERALLVHALRRYASGDNTGILINTYGDKEK
jgi:hypothetical protein